MLNRAALRQRIGAATLRGSQLREKRNREFLSTGMKHLDLLLSGGIPRGQMTEIIGPASSGKTSLLLSILSQATTRGEVVAYIDSFASLDPVFARKAGIDLQRLLWVRGGTSFLPEKTLKAADILAGAGGFGVVVLDLETQGREVNPGAVQKIPFHCWFRLKRTVRGTPTILLILGNEATAGSAASVVISLRRRKAQWCFTTQKALARISHTQSTAAADLAAPTALLDPQAGTPRPPQRSRQYVCGGRPVAGTPRAPCIHSHLHRLATIGCEKCGLPSLLRGICNEVELLRGKNPNHATFYSHF